MPKFSLRELFALVTIAALAMGWWFDRSRLVREKKELIGELLPLKLAEFRATQDATLQKTVESPNQSRRSK